MKHFTLLFLLLYSLSGSILHAQQTEIQYLSGTGYGSTVKWNFRCSDGRQSGQWKKIEVPSCWEQQGFGSYTYGRYYKYPDQQPSDETGLYRHTFSVPSRWKGRSVELVFEGVMTDADVRINGSSAGAVHQGGFTRFSYDVTDKLHYGGQNRLEVHVSKQSANASVNRAERQADWWLFGGIYRPVYLRVKPQTHIEHLAIDARADGWMHLHLSVNHPLEGMQVRCRLQEAGAQGREASEQCQPLKQVDGRHLTSFRWIDIRTWDPEHPNLYSLNVSLLDSSGRLLHEEQQRIGFRTVEFRRHDGIYLNGTKLIVKGTNRHSFWPESGRTINRDIALQDAQLIKQMNMNAVRSHYPPDTYFLDICDSLGLLYLNELPGWQWCYDDTTALRMVPELVRRDVNHPCIYLWSNGNEGGWNPVVDGEFRRYDPQHRHVVHPWAKFDGVDALHYPHYHHATYRLDNGSDIFMPTEFLHGLYDRGQAAGLADYWAKYMQSPLFAGGYLWAFLDEAVCRTDQGSRLDSYGPNGPDGIVGPYREKEGSFWAVREIWSPLQVPPFHPGYSFDGSFLVANRFLFSRADESRMHWRLLQADSPAEGGSESVLAQGNVALPPLQPGEVGRACFPLPTNFPHGDILELEAYYANGDTMCTWRYPLKSPARYWANHSWEKKNTPLPSARIVERDSLVELRAREICALFDRKTSLLTRIVASGDTLPLRNGPQLAGMKMELLHARAHMQGDTALWIAHYRGAVDSIVWRLTPDGRLGMEAVILNRRDGGGFRGDFVDSPVYHLGFSFDYPEASISRMRWMGGGPYRVWRNRQQGAPVGIWEKAYNNTVTGEFYHPLIYPEFKGYHSHLYWATLTDQHQRPMTLYTENEGIYLRMFTPEESQDNQDRGQQFISFPSGDISFLLEVPGVRCGSLLHQLGPSSHPSAVKINPGDEGFRIRLWFYVP